LPITSGFKTIIVCILANTVLMFLCPYIAINSLYSQELSRKEKSDTLIKKKPVINQSLINSFHADIMLPQLPGESVLLSPGYMHQSLLKLPLSLSMQFQQQIDVASPWKQEVAKQNELHTLRTVLGAVQAGGTAYLLYEHIKKYGLK
jgi:hypothetical protein